MWCTAFNFCFHNQLAPLQRGVLLDELDAALRLGQSRGPATAFQFDGESSGLLGASTPGRSLHSSTFQLNFSALYEIESARGGCVVRVKAVSGGV